MTIRGTFLVTSFKPKAITVHCTATKNGEPVTRESLHKWHVLENGWSDIGYHGWINPCGTFERGRPYNAIGAHVAKGNVYMMGINVGLCMAGTNKFTIKQYERLRWEMDTLVQLYDVPPWQIFTHNHFPTAQAQGKACPGFPINILLAWYIGHRYDALEPYLLK